jgi:cyanate permease
MNPKSEKTIEKQRGHEKSRYRWVILALLWLIYLSFGALNRTIAPLVTPILADLKLSYSQMGLVMGSWQLTYIGAAFAAGFLIDKWGIRKSLLLGIVIIALSTGLRYFAQGFGTFLPIVALFGIGGPLLSTGCPKAISIWFQGRERGTAVGIYTTGPWIGGAFVLAATNKLVLPLAGYNWRLTFVFYGLFALTVAFLWLLLGRERIAEDRSTTIHFKSVFIKLIRVRNVQAAVLIGLITFAILHGLTSWLPKILESKGFSSTTAGYIASIPLLAGIPSVLILPRIIPPHHRGKAVAFAALMVLASAWMFFGMGNIMIYFVLGLYGIGWGTLFPLITLVLMDTPEVGTELMGSASGLFFCISEIGGFMGPSVIGLLVDWTGGFTAAGYFVVVLSLAIFVLSFVIQYEKTK